MLNLLIMFLPDYPVDRFCESRYNGAGPEWMNVISSVAIFYYGMDGLLRQYVSTSPFYTMLMMNGIFSGLYHYIGYAIWKVGDEMTMVMGWYFLTESAIIVHSPSTSIRRLVTTVSNYLMILGHLTILFMNDLFPFYFFWLVIYTTILIKDHVQTKTLLYLSVGFLFWLLQEVRCSEFYWLPGHAIWHILFPLGASQAMLDI